MDWLWDEEEVLIFEQIEALIFGGGIKSLLITLLEVIDEYERFVARFGQDFREQIEKVFEALTGD